MSTAIEAMKRAQYLLEVVQSFMDANPTAEGLTVIYDDAECDGSCLADDCGSAAYELGLEILAAEKSK